MGKVGVVGDIGFGKRARDFSYNDEESMLAIKQLYLSYSPWENVKFTGGSWATHIGYELVDAPAPESPLGIDHGDGLFQPAADLKLRAQLLAIPGPAGFTGDAGFRLLGALAIVGGHVVEMSQNTLSEDQIAVAFDAGVNPFAAMLAGSTKRGWHRLDGVVRIAGRVPQMPLLSPWADPQCVMTANSRDDSVLVSKGMLANAIVIAEEIDLTTGKAVAESSTSSRGWSRPRKPGQKLVPRLRLRECRLEKRVLVGIPGESLAVSASDLTHFELELRENGKGELVGTANLDGPHGVADLGPITKEGLFTLTDRLHPWLRGLIVLTEGPATVTARDGSYSLNLAPGDYRLHVIHEVFEGMTRIIKVEQDATHDFVVSTGEVDIALRK